MRRKISNTLYGVSVAVLAVEVVLDHGYDRPSLPLLGLGFAIFIVGAIIRRLR